MKIDKLYQICQQFPQKHILSVDITISILRASNLIMRFDNIIVKHYKTFNYTQDKIIQYFKKIYYTFESCT
jgi:hypothetical protein